MWKQISKEQIKDVKIGDRIRVNNFEVNLQSHFGDPNYYDNDYGFYTKGFFREVHGNLSRIFSEDCWRDSKNIVEVLCESSTLTNTLFDESYPDYETAITNEVLVDFVETHVQCEHHEFIEKLLEVLTHEQCKELVKTIFHLESSE